MPRPKRAKVQTARAVQRAALAPKSTNSSPRKLAVTKENRNGKNKVDGQASKENRSINANRAASAVVAANDGAADVDGDGVTEISSSPSLHEPGSLVRTGANALVSKVTDSFPAIQPSAPPSVSRIHATPSMVSLSNFKRRPRQPSILQMVQQRLDMDELMNGEDDSVLALGRPITPTVTQSAGSGEEESPVPQRSPSPRKRSREEDDVTVSGSLDASLSRKSRRLSKRRSSQLTRSRESAPVVQVPSSQSHAASGLRDSITGAVQSLSPRGAPSSQITQSIEPCTPPRRRNAPRVNPMPSLATGTKEDCASPESTPQSSPAKERRRTHSHAQILHTSKLQTLLPKRRRRRRTPIEDFDVRDVGQNTPGEHDDELHRPVPRRPQTTKNGNKSRGHKTQRIPPGTTQNTGKPDESAGSRRLSKRYGRSSDASHVTGEEEASLFSIGQANEDEDDNDFTSGLPNRAEKHQGATGNSKELQLAAEKFKNVDEWELSFESQDVEGGSSSPWR